MLYAYGAWMPIRILDEAEFWKQQESEHTVVIRELSDDLEREYVESLKQWEQQFVDFEIRVTRYIETALKYGSALPKALYNEILQLTRSAVEQSEQFLRFLEEMEKNSRAISGNQTAVVVVRHIRRESEYFIGVVQGILYPSGHPAHS
ncbi:MAG: DUF2935 domain-containing protein [Firmicutes bacterium]|uniref:DUF2935 domain-containing protein n=1 Tax=Melghirimyces thermohalophilus TaxID=1236220 RepID=A0A1G6PUI9_9BACL|nr:DUF2935 domain-containing protein [Melghirimyces thermohalophilus]MDA8351644.1 DUF2935 domain-containing protein [Bacillota bacterium]SDC83334.1 protein of unknown function [Melghirimyces thermohalophilus]